MLGLVLTVFLLVGLMWAYVELDTRAPSWNAPPFTPAEQSAVDAYTQAESEPTDAQRTMAASRDESAPTAGRRNGPQPPVATIASRDRGS